MEIDLNGFGQYLGVDKVRGNFLIYEKGEIKQRIPIHNVDFITITSGNNISSNALFWASIYGIETLIISDTGRPKSLLMPMRYYTNAKTRINQYKAQNSSKGFKIAKKVIEKKIRNQIVFLNSHYIKTSKLEAKLRQVEALKKEGDWRRSLFLLEGHCSSTYFHDYTSLVMKVNTDFNIWSRKKRGAIDPVTTS